jgi:ferredoxin
MLKFQGYQQSFEIEAEPQLNLLAHAQLDDWSLGSTCGGHGECGGDRIQIQDAPSNDFSPLTQREREHLNEAEIKAGWRLACQCWPERREVSATIVCRRLSRG